MPDGPTKEIELKSVVDDLADRRKRVEKEGGKLLFEGSLEDRRYDTRKHALWQRDHVLRLRVYRDKAGARGMLDWKGPTRYDGGSKVRGELSTTVGDPDVMAALLEKLGYIVTREIDREIAQYQLGSVIVRFERFPRMDPLVEVEGDPAGIEKAISTLALPREGFVPERLKYFMRNYEDRTGTKAAISHRELLGDFRYSAEDA
jgi:predicted adenylyl cyclase CyaB